MGRIDPLPKIRKIAAMNGPMKMYRARQIVRHDLGVSLPNCMYKLKNIHAASGETGPLGDHVSPSQGSVDISEQSIPHLPEMTALIDRQQKILKQLDELRQQMITLKSDLSTSNGPVTTKTFESSVTRPLKINKLPNIIINASPTHPPYSLLLIQKLWSNCFHLRVTTHLHSTICALPEQAATLSEALENYHPQLHQSTINLRLIWKDVGPNPELIVSQIPIVGETNILRYLARMCPEFLCYETLANVCDIDSVLDVCYCLVRARTKTERTSLIQSLSKKLGKADWLCGSPKMSIADIAASSAIQQVAGSEINQSMTKWLQRCNAIVK